MMRILAILSSVLATLGLMFIPAIRGGELSGKEHGLMSLLLVLISLGYIYGLGIRFERAWANWLISPIWVIPAMALIVWRWVSVAG